MLYQKCSACHSEWNAIKMVIECPFCGNAFEMQTSNFKSVEDTFRYIICTHGFEVIKQKSTFVSLLADYAPTLEKERRVVKMALESGVYLELMSVSKTDEQEQAAAQAKAINKLNKDYLLEQVWAKQAVLWFVSQLGWTSVVREVHKKIIPAKEVVKQENATQKQVNKQPEASSVTPELRIQNNTMTVSSMDHVPDSRWSRDKSWESVEKIVLGPGITEIKMEAFRGLKDLREVVLPEGLKKIGFSAFADCIKLDNVVIPEGTTTIAAHAFEKCNKLANITIPKSVKYIGDDAFNATAIKSATVQKDCVICRENYQIKASAE